MVKRDDLTQVIRRDLTKERKGEQIEKIPVSSIGWVVESIDGPAKLRVGSKNAYPYPLRKIRNIQLPQRFSNFYLENEATSGELIIHFLQKDGLKPLNISGPQDLPIKDTVAQGLDFTQPQEIALDTGSFGRSKIEIIGITYDSDGNYPGNSTDFTLYVSPRGQTWYQADSQSGTTLWQDGWFTAFRYLKLESKGDGASGETVDLIITANK